MQSTASNSPSIVRWKTVSGEWGPVKTSEGRPVTSDEFNSATAGVMISISSRPTFPDSPARSFNRRFARIAIWLPANDDVLGRIRDASRFQSEIDDLWSDAGAIAECNSDARFCGAHISARDRNRICSIAHPSCAPLWLGKRAAIRGKDRRLTLGGRGKAEIRSEGLDVSLCAKAGDPAFLYPLCFHLE